MAGSSEQCPHGMGSPEWCSLCKNVENPSVYITGGGLGVLRGDQKVVGRPPKGGA